MRTVIPTSEPLPDLEQRYILAAPGRQQVSETPLLVMEQLTRRGRASLCPARIHAPKDPLPSLGLLPRSLAPDLRIPPGGTPCLPPPRSCTPSQDLRVPRRAPHPRRCGTSADDGQAGQGGGGEEPEPGPGRRGGHRGGAEGEGRGRSGRASLGERGRGRGTPPAAAPARGAAGAGGGGWGGATRWPELLQTQGGGVVLTGRENGQSGQEGGRGGGAGGGCSLEGEAFVTVALPLLRPPPGNRRPPGLQNPGLRCTSSSCLLLKEPNPPADSGSVPPPSDPRCTDPRASSLSHRSLDQIFLSQTQVQEPQPSSSDPDAQTLASSVRPWESRNQPPPLDRVQSQFLPSDPEIQLPYKQINLLNFFLKS